MASGDTLYLEPEPEPEIEEEPDPEESTYRLNKEK